MHATKWAADGSDGSERVAERGDERTAVDCSFMRSNNSSARARALFSTCSTTSRPWSPCLCVAERLRARKVWHRAAVGWSGWTAVRGAYLAGLAPKFERHGSHFHLLQSQRQRVIIV